MELIHSNLQGTNEPSEKCSADIIELIKTLESTQDQLNEEISNVKERTEKSDKNIKKAKNDLLDPDEVSFKLLNVRKMVYRKHIYTKKKFRI